jgi:hypothetical protein
VPIPSDQLPIGEGVHPDGTPGAAFFVDRPMLDALEEFGPAEKHDDGRFVYECVSQPDAIFEGLRRGRQEDGLCYSVRPTHDPMDPDSETLPRYGFAFLTFVRPDFTKRTWPTN